MSKAFTRESDDTPEPSPRPRSAPVLPEGARNYVTPAGATRLREELETLAQIERPRLAAGSDDETRERLRTLDQRIRRLEQSLATAVVVPPPVSADDQVRFGATVLIRNRAGGESSYRIVGMDETDLDRDWVSWVSPIARALLNRRRGERVLFRFPTGEEELEIVDIRYD